MNIAGRIKVDCANGTGTRYSLFVSGCTNRCKGCFQPETWDFNYGEPYTKELENEILTELAKPYYHGLTILGGDPFELQNQETVCNLIHRIKTALPTKTIWMYTGYVYDEDLMPNGKRYIKHITDSILDNIDVLVDGPFIEEQRDITLQFKGSTNQRIIDMKQTRATNTVILCTLPQRGE